MNAINLRMFRRSVGPLAVCGLLVVANSPAVKAADTVPAKNESALRFLAVDKTAKAFQEPLDLKVENLTLEQLINQIRSTLAARKATPLPKIDVRGVQPVKLSFAVKNSTAGKVLSAAATLAGGKLWMLGDYSVIAPDISLSAGERAAQKAGLLSSWAPTPEELAAANQANRAKREAFYSFIASEIAGGGIAGELPPLVRIQAPGQGQTLNVDDLSSDARMMLGILVENFKSGIDNANIPTKGAQFNLTSQDRVHINADKTLFVNFASDNRVGKSMSWGFEDIGLGKPRFTQKASSGTPSPTTHPKQTPSVSPLVPSAGGS